MKVSPATSEASAKSGNGQTVSPIQIAMSDPVVRKLMDLFEGQLIDVKPPAPNTGSHPRK